jgi:uncharacterized protein YjbJ (UPF0337 family)
MNKDQTAGKAKQFVGNMQEQFGRVMGSRHQQSMGMKRQVDGKIQEVTGDLKKSVEDPRVSK